MQSLTRKRNHEKRVTVVRAIASVVYARAASFGGFSRLEVMPGGAFASGWFRSKPPILVWSGAFPNVVERDQKVVGSTSKVLGDAGHKGIEPRARMLVRVVRYCDASEFFAGEIGLTICSNPHRAGLLFYLCPRAMAPGGLARCFDICAKGSNKGSILRDAQRSQQHTVNVRTPCSQPCRPMAPVAREGG